MNCLECNKKLNYFDHQNSVDLYGVSLCKLHKIRIDKLVVAKNTPIEAIILYYGLKENGIQPMLEWWDGTKSIDLAISRVKLNIEIDSDYTNITDEQAVLFFKKAIRNLKNGFTTIHIPRIIVKYYLKETVSGIESIIKNLKINLKTF